MGTSPIFEIPEKLDYRLIETVNYQLLEYLNKARVLSKSRLGLLARLKN